MRLVICLVAFMLAGPAPAKAEDRLLKEAVEFHGAVLFHALKVPGLVIGVTRNGNAAVAGFGAVKDGANRAPDGDTLLRIGSITKVFTGQMLASLVADGKVKLTDRLDQRLKWRTTIPSRDGRPIRLIELATHTSGLPREVEREPGPENDPFRTITKKAFVRSLAGDSLLFAPGAGALYSNFAFDLLAAALADAAGQPYETLLRRRVLEPAGLTATGFTPDAAQRRNLLQGHGFGGEPLPDVPTAPITQGSGGLYSSANDILRWLDWHLDRFEPKGAEVRLIDHAAYVSRDGLSPVLGLDESGHMDAMGLGWIIMRAEGDRPLVLQKAGGLQGVFAYAAFAPTRGVGAFIAINQFDFSAAEAMAKAVNDLISDLAPR
ncbi:MAG: D-alanyl-D-alanine-carboxypeptidase/endopeptidase AmpH [Methylocystis sp.]